MLAQAGVQGVAIPLMTAAMGGLVGAALWFGRWKPVVYCVLATLVLFAALGLWEATPALEGIDFGAHLMFAVIALLALRIGLQYFLLREDYEADRTRIDALPPIAGCSRLWVRASSSSSRRG